MKNKISFIILSIFVNFNLYAATSTEHNFFWKIHNSIEKGNYTEEFYYLLKVISFLLFMYAIYTGFVSDNQQKGRQEKFWSVVFMFSFAVVLRNFKCILVSLGEISGGCTS